MKVADEENNGEDLYDITMLPDDKSLNPLSPERFPGATYVAGLFPKYGRTAKLNATLRQAGLSVLNDSVATDLFAEEDKLTENREHLETLLDRRVISEEQYATLLDRCFHVFHEHACELIGKDACHAIYGEPPAKGSAQPG